MWRYVTTPIYYANARPHIGHLYTTVFADTYSRWARATGAEVIFTTGMDEHGLKIQRNAVGRGITPKEFCDETAARFKELFSRMHIDYTRFYRTTDQSHKEAVWSLWRRMESAGFIYKGKHEGWYCSAEERFMQRNQLISTKNGGLMTADKYPVEWVQEENYFFRMEPLKGRVEQWLRSPALDSGLREQSLRDLNECGPISISRPRSRVAWGIPVPGDEQHTIHVWLDALTSYVAGVGFPDSDLATNPFWQNSLHVLGMEISRFHSLHLPAFLMAAGIPPPAKLKVHSHWLNRSVKMSKSLGNAVDPEVLIKLAGAEAFRFYLLYKGPQNVSDSEFTLEDFSKVINYLGDRFGNLLARITSPKVMKTSLPATVELRPPEEFDAVEETLLEKVDAHMNYAYKSYNKADFQQAMVGLSQVWSELNVYAEKRQPWSQPDSKSPYVILEVVRTTLPYLAPVMPAYSDVLRKFLGADEHTSGQFRRQGTLQVDLRLRNQLRITKIRPKDLDT